MVKVPRAGSSSKQQNSCGRTELQNFWQGVVKILVCVLEMVDELELMAEVISAIQTSLKLLDNENVHNIIALMKTLLIQMNSQIKNLVRNGDFKDAAPMLFGESFGTLAKERLEVLTKILGMDTPCLDFYTSQTSHGGSHYSGGHWKQSGWQPSNR